MLTGKGAGSVPAEEVDDVVERLLFGSVAMWKGERQARQAQVEEEVDRSAESGRDDGLLRGVGTVARGISNALSRAAPRLSRVIRSRISRADEEIGEVEFEDEKEADLLRRFEELEKKLRG